MKHLPNQHTQPSTPWQIQNHFERVAYQLKKSEQPHPDAPRPYNVLQNVPRPDVIAVLFNDGVATLMPYSDVSGALKEGRIKVLRHANNYNWLFEGHELIDIPVGTIPVTRITLNQSFNMKL